MLNIEKILWGIFRLKSRLFTRKHIVIACFPKSASSFLKNLLVESTGFKEYNYKPASKNYNDILYFPRIIQSLHFDNICQQHFRCSYKNEQYLLEASINPIVLVRNIFDAIVSYKEHITKADGHKLMNAENVKEFLEFDEEKKYDYVIDMVVPWYISFYVSWYEASIVDKKIEALWISYEEMVKEPDVYVKKVLDFIGHDISDDKIKKALEKDLNKSKTRFNVGIKGRGSTLLSEEQQQKIKDYTKYYSHVDFSLIGL